MALLKEELYCKHTNELRAMSGFKRLPVKYKILQHLEEENTISNELDSNCWNSSTFLVTPTKISHNKLKEESGRTIPLESPVQSPAGSPTRSSLFSVVLTENKTDTDTAGITEDKPDIEDLQREAYLAGLRAEGSNDSGHPYAKMYRYLWVEKDLFEENGYEQTSSSDEGL